VRPELKEAGSEDFKREKDGSVFYLALARAVASSKRTMSDSEVRCVSQQRQYDMVSLCADLLSAEHMLTKAIAAQKPWTSQGATANQAPVQAREGEWVDCRARG
jgi:hypothetical protein